MSERMSWPTPEEWEVSGTQLAARLASDTPRLRLIDCREEDEHAFCRLPGSESVPLTRFAEEAAARGLLPAPDSSDSTDDEPTELVIYCHHGMRSLQAAVFLRQRGLQNVWSLAGGIDAWSTDIDPEVPRY